MGSPNRLSSCCKGKCTEVEEGAGSGVHPIHTMFLIDISMEDRAVGESAAAKAAWRVEVGKQIIMHATRAFGCEWSVTQLSAVQGVSSALILLLLHFTPTFLFRKGCSPALQRTFRQ